MYHQTSDASSAPLNVPPESFARQMEWLDHESFKFLSLDEVLSRQGLVSLWEKAVALTFDDGYRDNFENAFPRLTEKGRPAALFIVVDWVEKKGFMNWDEIRDLSKRGITVGSHSVSHRWLPRIEDPQELRREIFDSKKKIEDEIGKEVKHFSYPVGGVDERVAELVQGAGYGAGWIAGARPTVKIRNPSYLLRRIKVTPSDSRTYHFAAKAYGLKNLF